MVQCDVVLDVQWQKWLSSWQSGGDKREGQAEVLVEIINQSSGHLISEEIVFNHEYQHLRQLTNTICYRLCCHQKDMVSDTDSTTIMQNDKMLVSKFSCFGSILFNSFFFRPPLSMDIKHTTYSLHI